MTQSKRIAKKIRITLDNIKLDKLLLVIFCLLLSILIFKTFLIPMVLSMVSILLKLVDLYKLLEMPYLFFGSAFFLFMVWYLFNLLCNIIYKLFKFAVTTQIYKSEDQESPHIMTNKVKLYEADKEDQT